jgi:hypothetical protein
MGCFLPAAYAQASVAGRIRRISACRAAVVRSRDGRTDGGGADAHADTTAHIGATAIAGSAIGGSPIGAAGANTTCVDTTGANTAHMDASGTAAASGVGRGRHARDHNDCCCQASHGDSI